MKKIRSIVFFLSLTICLMLTAVAANAAECNHSWSQADKTGAPCTGYTYIYSCHKCLATREEKTAATQAHNWYVTTSKEPTCEENGHIQAVCLGCGELKQETKDALGHTYVYASRNDATCTKDGTSFRTCQRCGDRDIVPDKGSAKGHKFSDEWYVVEESTCIKKGVKKQVCTVCGAGIFRDIEDFGPHRDKDGDRRCDLCREELSVLDPVVPGGDGSDRYDCDCNCHEGGIKGFFWKIGNFFCKLFRIKSKQVCDCGRYHF